MKLSWNRDETSDTIAGMLTALGGHYPIEEGADDAVQLSFKKAKGKGTCSIELSDSTATVKCSTTAQAGRAVGALLSDLVTPQKPYNESTPFESLGIMLDCSRNAVMTVDHVKVWLRKLALLGYNMVMLYTEDTYELPEEPYFGYQRGAYTPDELKQIDEYACELDIQVIPCIQTLGHLEHILKHGAYWKVKDTRRVMLVGEKETYKLIEKMVKHWKSVCSSGRIHVGMDETHDLGLGRYLDLNGYRHGFKLFNEHLAKVVKICKKHGLKPMIWSDMYFRLGCKSGSYYDKSTVIPKKVVKKIPKKAELVYWDYYHDNKEFYLDWIKRHRKLGKEPLMGSGIWTWNKYWHDHRSTERAAGPCIEACRESKVKEIFFTQWGDNGAYCDHDSAFAGMTWAADKAYGTTIAPKTLEARFDAVCGGSYAAHRLASEIHGSIEGVNPDLWDDPLFETKFRTWAKDDTKRMTKVAGAYARLAAKLKPLTRDRATGNLAYAYSVAQLCADRYGFSAKLLAAYRSDKKTTLAKLAKEIPALRRSVRRMADAFRAMWLSHNKPNGLETIQARFGMLDERYREMTTRIKEYLDGTIDSIAELDCKCPPE